MYTIIRNSCIFLIDLCNRLASKKACEIYDEGDRFPN